MMNGVINFMLWWMCLVKGSLVVGLVLSVCGYFVLNG